MKIAHFIIATSIISLTVFLLMPMSAYPWLDIKVEGSVSEIYDDNTTFTEENEKSDSITNLTLSLAVKYEGKTQTLKFIGHINQQIFAENHGFNNTSQDFDLIFSSELSKYDRISLENVFTHTYEPRSFEEAFGRTGGRYSYYRNRFNFNYTKDISKQFSLITRYANEINEISREDLKDSYLNKVGFEVDYFTSFATLLLFSYGFANRKFEYSKDASIQTMAIGIRPYISKRVYFDGKIGVDFINSYNDKGYSKPLILASLTDEISRNTRAGLSFAKQYNTDAYTEDIFNYWQTSAFFKRELLKRLRYSLSGFYGEGEYVSLDIIDKLWGANIALTYDFREKLRGNLGYTYSDLDSTDVSREYIKNTVFLSLTVEF